VTATAAQYGTVRPDRSGMGSTPASAKVNDTGNSVDLELKTMEVRFLH
tara:strand:+ start:4640 stop:4783 length:144 start_codon:yes stop_codon:yes gene_type:complete